MNELYVGILRSQVEKQAQIEPVTTAEFSELSEVILRVTGERLSVSTLKRVWARVKDDYSRRPVTLSILARYVGYRTWTDFVNTTRDNLREESDFKPVNAIDFDQLPENVMVKVSWMPDRMVKFLHGESRNFVVLESVNSKLRAGDECEISMLASEEPMFVSSIKRGDKTYHGYVAGQIHGVHVEILG